MPKRVDLSAADWRKSDAQIARDFGVHYVTVAKHRKKLGKPRYFADWSTVDWSHNNRQIAQDIGRSYQTVCDKRCQLGKARLAKPAARVNKQAHYPNLFRPHLQALGTAGAKKSQKSGKFETNCHAKKWKLTAPDGKIYHITNLYHFVRTHTELFNPQDIVWKRTNGKRGTGGEYCNATAGLLNITSGKAKTWKGWSMQKD